MWKTLQDFLRDIGIDDAIGPKPVIRIAFREGLVADGDGWSAMRAALEARR